MKKKYNLKAYKKYLRNFRKDNPRLNDQPVAFPLWQDFMTAMGTALDHIAKKNYQSKLNV